MASLEILLVLLVHSLCAGLVVNGRAVSEESVKIHDAQETDVELVPEKKPLDVDDYLEKYGYLVPPKSKSEKRPSYSEETRNQAIKQFQKFYGLPATGLIDEETVSVMNQPRCGVPDILTDYDPTKPQEYNTGSRWTKASLRWKVLTYSNKLTEDVQRAAFESAFRHWSRVSALDISEAANATNDTADILLTFAAGDHGDGQRNAFDGRGGVLAHAYEPEDGSAHFDADERWVYHNNNGTELEMVATHELGHSLGLAHSIVRSSVMFPLSKPYTETFGLDADDIAGIQSLYGLPTPSTTTSTTTKPAKANIDKKDKKKKKKKPKKENNGKSTKKDKKPLEPPASDIDLCKARFDAITRGPDDKIHLFIGSQLYKLKDYCEQGVTCVEDGYPVPVRNVYKRAPRKIAAAAYIPDQRKRTYLFKGRKMWRYTNLKLDKGYPMKMNASVLPFKPSAAYVQKNQFADYQMYLFGAQYFWEFNLYTETMANDKMLVDTYWDFVPKKPDAIFQTMEGNIYIFKGKNYRKYDHLRDAVENKKPIAPAWIGGECGFSAR